MATCGVVSSIVILAINAGCVTLSRGQKMEEAIATLESRQRDASKEADMQRARLDEQILRADKKIEEVSAALQELNRAARMTDADFGVQLERLIKDSQELRGTMELSDYRLTKLEKAVENTAAHEATQGSEAVANPLVPAAPPAPALPKDKKELLSYAIKVSHEGQANEARGVFRDIIKQWPKDPGITDAAYFYLGETYANEKKCNSAVPEYIQVIEKFTTSDYIDDAYYHIGLCSIELGNLEDAQIFLNEVVTKYKKSPLVKAAKSKLDEVNKRLEQEKSRGKPARSNKKK